MAQRLEAYQVIVSNRLVAHLFSRGQNMWLDWQKGYWEDPHRPVLGMTFEDSPGQRISSTQVLPPWFGHLLPEGVLRRWVAQDIKATSPAELPLLRRLGHDLPGAVQVVAAEGDVDPSWHPETVVAPSRPPDVTSSGLRFSLAGVALKFSMVSEADRLVIPAHDEDGDWIAKMPDAVHAFVPHNEFAVMTMAARVGIDVPTIRLVHRDQVPDPPDAAWPNREEWAYAIRRFDRPRRGVRTHMEDMAQVRGVPVGDAKYLGSYETVGNIVTRALGREAYLEFVRRVFFSYAVGNGDLHLKNLSILYPDGRGAHLAPAYDLVSTAGYGFEGADEMALRLDRARRFSHVSPQSFDRLARRVGESVDATRDVVQRVAAGLPAAWDEVEESLAMLPGHQRWLADRIADVSRRFA